MIHKQKGKLIQNRTQNNQGNVGNKEYICVPYNTKFNKAIRKTFTKNKFILGYRTTNNAFELIKKKSNLNVQQDKFKKSGIYELRCSDCDKFYIGQTGRNFHIRFREHIQALKSKNYKQKSAFAEHLIDSGHNFTDINSCLLKCLATGYPTG